MSDTGATTEECPYVSVVVPVYNDPAGIKKTIECLLEQTYPPERYEIIVSDNNSTDQTQTIVESYCERFPDLVTLQVEEEIQSPAATRNEGIESATGSIFAFVDADMSVDRKWIESGVQALNSNKYDYMGCAVETVSSTTNPSLATKYDELFAFDIKSYIDDSHFSGGGCLFVRKSVIEEVGAFDQALVYKADKEFGTRVYEAGFKIGYEPSVEMYHPARSSLREQIKKSFRLGRGTTHLHEVYPERFEQPDLFRIRNYVPMRVSSFLEKLPADYSGAKREMVGFYAIASIKKISSAVGRLYESFGGTRKTR